MFISIHIPKTAGTTVAYILDYGTNRRIFYDYEEDYNEAPPTEYLQRHREFITDKFDVIHGHFLYKKYAETFPHEHYLATLRHPVSRVVSQYNHILDEPPGVGAWPNAEILSGNMDVVEFAGIYNIGNAQTVFLEGQNMADYAHFFLTERLEQSIALFQKKFMFARRDAYAGQGLPTINTRSTHQRYYKPSKTEEQEIFKLTSDDNELYAKAMQRHETEAKKYF